VYKALTRWFATRGTGIAGYGQNAEAALPTQGKAGSSRHDSCGRRWRVQVVAQRRTGRPEGRPVALAGDRGM